MVLNDSILTEATKINLITSSYQIMLINHTNAVCIDPVPIRSNMVF